MPIAPAALALAAAFLSHAVIFTDGFYVNSLGENLGHHVKHKLKGRPLKMPSNASSAASAHPRLLEVMRIENEGRLSSVRAELGRCGGKLAFLQALADAFDVS